MFKPPASSLFPALVTLGLALGACAHTPSPEAPGGSGPALGAASLPITVRPDRSRIGCTPELAMQAPGQDVAWTLMEPPVLSAEAPDEAVRLTVCSLEPRAAVVLERAGGEQLPYASEDGKLWTLVVPATKLLEGYGADDEHRNVVGKLRVEKPTGAVSRRNVVANVWDRRMRPVPVSAPQRSTQATGRVLNVWGVSARFDGAAVQDAVKSLLLRYPDHFDMVNVVSGMFDVPANRYHITTRNTVHGIGLSPALDNTAPYGSAGKLQGVNVFPIGGFFDLAETSNLHEFGHRWAVHLGEKMPLFAGTAGHWPVSPLAAGVMGFMIPGNGGGTFPFSLTALGNGDYRLDPPAGVDPRRFNDWDLYLMGLIPASDVKPSFVFTNQNQTLCTGCVLKGPVQTVTVQDVIAAYGPRLPGPATSQKHFRIATVVLSPYPLSERAMAFYDAFASRGEAKVELPFAMGLAKGKTLPVFLATGGRVTWDTSLE